MSNLCDIENNSFNYILKNIDNKQYFLLNYYWFKDYYKIINAIYHESVLRYNPSKNTKHFIEFTVISDSIGGVVKIPIIKTNIKSEFISKIKHNIYFSKFNNDLIALIFDDNNITIRYNYSTKIKYIELDNSKYSSLSYEKNFKSNSNENNLSEEEEEEYDENYEINKNFSKMNNISDENITKINQNLCCNHHMNSYYLSEENYTLDEQDKIYQNINDDTIKNVICYVNIEFENLKEMFKKLGNGKINIIIKNNTMTMKSIVPKLFNKQVLLEISVINFNKNYYNKEINFFINSNSIIKLKSLSNNFNIVSVDNKKIFKYVELKVVVNNDSNQYGITIFPGNFTAKNRNNDKIFDLYTSIMLYIPEIM